MKWRVIVMVALGVTLLASYGLLTRREDDGPVTRAAAREPGWYLRDATLTDTDAGGASQVVLRAAYIQQDASTNNVELEQVNLVYSGEQGAWNLDAARGHVPANSRRIDFSGDVVVRPQGTTTHPITLRGETLSVDTTSNIATSADFVTTEMNGQRLTGKGMRADLNRQQVRFAEEVEGTLQSGRVTDDASAPKLECAGIELDAKAKELVCPKVRITQNGHTITATEGRAAGTDFENNEWTFTGDVVLTTPDGRCNAERAVVTFQNNMISRARVTGQPATFETRSGRSETPIKGRANTVDYDLLANTVKLQGEAWVSNGESEFTAAVLNYDIGAQRMSAPAEDQNGQKVRIVVNPADRKKK